MHRRPRARRPPRASPPRWTTVAAPGNRPPAVCGGEGGGAGGCGVGDAFMCLASAPHSDR